MCPGGEVVAAASEEGGLCVNGMSRHARAGANANAALLVEVRPDDLPGDDPLAGVAFPRALGTGLELRASTAVMTASGLAKPWSLRSRAGRASTRAGDSIVKFLTVDEAADALAAGEAVVMPTDTVYISRELTGPHRSTLGLTAVQSITVEANPPPLAPHGPSRTPAVRETRLPRSFARSALIRWISASLLKLPSCPNATSRICCSAMHLLKSGT